ESRKWVSTGLSTSDVAERLYDRYAFPDWLRDHSRLVGAIAGALALARRGIGDDIDVESVTLAGYLHDIGRSPLLKGDPREHNELSALILAAEGLEGCVEPARRHAIYTVLDPKTAPRTMSEKVVYIADRRGGIRRRTSICASRARTRTRPSYSSARTSTPCRWAGASMARSVSAARSKRSCPSSSPERGSRDRSKSSAGPTRRARASATASLVPLPRSEGCASIPNASATRVGHRLPKH